MGRNSGGASGRASSGGSGGGGGGGDSDARNRGNQLRSAATNSFNEGRAYSSSSFGRQDPALRSSLRPVSLDSVRSQVRSALSAGNPFGFSGRLTVNSAFNTVSGIVRQSAYQAGLARGLGQRAPSARAISQAAIEAARKFTFSS